MAQFQLELPNSIIKDIEKIYNNTDEIFGQMTRAGAEVALANAQALAPSTISSYGKISKTYKTPSDGGINTKIYFSGYIPFSDPNRKYFSRRGKPNSSMYSTTMGVPVEFLANLYEYGRSTAPFPKHPFLRKAFNKGQIESAMLAEQVKQSGGLLE